MKFVVLISIIFEINSSRESSIDNGSMYDVAPTSVNAIHKSGKHNLFREKRCNKDNMPYIETFYIRRLRPEQFIRKPQRGQLDKSEEETTGKINNLEKSAVIQKKISGKAKTSDLFTDNTQKPQTNFESLENAYNDLLDSTTESPYPDMTGNNYLSLPPEKIFDDRRDSEVFASDADINKLLADSPEYELKTLKPEMISTKYTSLLTETRGLESVSLKTFFNTELDQVKSISKSYDNKEPDFQSEQFPLDEELNMEIKLGITNELLPTQASFLNMDHKTKLLKPLAETDMMNIEEDTQIKGKTVSNFYEPITTAYDDRAEADRLKSKINVLCWIATSPNEHTTSATQIKQTWGSKCTMLLYMSSQPDSRLNVITVTMKDEWTKSRFAFRYMYSHYFNDTDWFLKTSDNSYMVMENLRYMLARFDPMEKIYFGNKIYDNNLRPSETYILSRAALEALVMSGLNQGICGKSLSQSRGAVIDKCLQSLGVKGIITNLTPRSTVPLAPSIKGEYWSFQYCTDEVDGNTDGCLDHGIGFNDVNHITINELHYLINELRPYGITAQSRTYRVSRHEMSL